ncbi:uncharacterized protein METZ01_LOCUS422721 [marine metagenome]|uniref:Uncharacterized protein n=1 Tax=marine metagenome TaxID=408172 RepID=A0A382XFB1_9ZZZZ
MVLLLLLIFLDRQNNYLIIVTILLLLILSTIAILRIVESRNKWREIFNEKSLDEDIT